jgi:amino-acid N-acetyltransferase
MTPRKPNLQSEATIFRHPPEGAVRRLLAEANLPTADVTAAHLEHFFGCGLQQAPKGIVGLELYGEHALLRSLAVDPDTRGRGCARALVEGAERHARRCGVRRLYLLTTTAADFFARLGYKRVEREKAPDSIRATSEFSTLCPSSSVLMLKEVPMATARQKAAARRNIKKAAKAARRKRTIAHLPKKARRALGKQAAKVARRKRH